MSTVQLSDFDPYRHGLFLGLVAIGILIGMLVGVGFFGFVQLLLGALSFAITLAFLYLFYRLVVAVERIEEQL